MTPGISDFLLARIAEDEEAARVASDACDCGKQGCHTTKRLADLNAKRRIVSSRPTIDVPGACLHIVHDEVQRQREYVWQLLASPYANHPDYDEAWRP